jgi:Transposase DDE domain
MSTLLGYAQDLVYRLSALMPSRYQRYSLQALLSLFLAATGQALPQHSELVSASGLSRFLNHYAWPTRAVIRAVRAEVVRQVKAQDRYGAMPILHVVLDLTTLEKVGKFKGLGSLVRVYNGKRGLHLVVLYLLIGQVRLPWGFRVYRGKGDLSPIQLAQRLILSLPKSLTQTYAVRILADTAFGSGDFLTWVKARPGLNMVAGVSDDRRLAIKGQSVKSLSRQGSQATLFAMTFPVTVSWYWVEREEGKREKRFVVSTEPLSGSYITRLGRRRWQIEGFFKVAKHRFSLHRFGQQTLLGVCRWIVLSLIAYFLAHCACLWSGRTYLPDWAVAAQLALECLLPTTLIAGLVLMIRRYQPLARTLGIDLSIGGCSSP